MSSDERFSACIAKLDRIQKPKIAHMGAIPERTQNPPMLQSGATKLYFFYRLFRSIRSLILDAENVA